MNISADQLRAARALLRLEQAELARRANVSVATIRRIERSNSEVAPLTFDGVRKTLEREGAEFIPEGVRRRPAPRSDRQELFAEMRALSLRSAERLRGNSVLSDADLYGEDGLPR